MKKLHTIQKVFSEFLNPRLDELEKNYSIHSSKIDNSFILIDNIKNLASNLCVQEDYSTNYTSNNDLSKSFISTSSKTNALNRSKIADKRPTSRGKTPYKSKTSGNILDKSADKINNRKSNINMKVTNNFSKGKNQTLLEKNKTSASTRTLTTHKSSSNISSRKNKPQEGGGLSPDKLKRNLSKTKINNMDVSPSNPRKSNQISKVNTPASHLSPGLQKQKSQSKLTKNISKPNFTKDKDEKLNQNGMSINTASNFNPSPTIQNFSAGTTLTTPSNFKNRESMLKENMQNIPLGTPLGLGNKSGKINFNTIKTNTNTTSSEAFKQIKNSMGENKSNSKYNRANSNSKSTKNKESELDKDFDFSKIIAIDQGLHDDSLINTKDDLLLNCEIHDSELLENLGAQAQIINKSIFIKEIKLEYEEILDDKWSNFTKYLTLQDEVKSLLINKKFGRYTILKFINILEAEKLSFEEKYNQAVSLGKSLTGGSEEVNNTYLTLSRGTNKAIDLLNENLYNKLFTDQSVPKTDILLVYQLYFQIIKHPIIKFMDDALAFWKETCKYFLNEAQGKTGNFIVNSLKNLDYSDENVYKITKLLGSNINKINPNYFAKLCGTTGLIVFFIKDAIDYLGIICEKKASSVNKTIKTLSGVISVLNSRINKLKIMLNKFYNN